MVQQHNIFISERDKKDANSYQWQVIAIASLT